MIFLIILIWIALGVHSAYYLVKQYTKHYDFESSEWWMILLCVLLPIITHISTYSTYAKKNAKKNADKKIWFKRV